MFVKEVADGIDCRFPNPIIVIIVIIIMFIYYYY